VSIEAVVLTGGKSERMGVDKSELLVDGEPLGRRTARLLAEAGYSVTVLGHTPIEGFGFLADKAQFEGPLIALSQFMPSHESVFVAACDMPRFDARIVKALLELLIDSDAAVPILDGKLQPTCALYSAKALSTISKVIDQGKRSLMAWIDSLTVKQVTESDLISGGVTPHAYLNANTPAEFQAILADN
jgi:molybdopterin-guanine dinucleotide biosynthesis protein A